MPDPHLRCLWCDGLIPQRYLLDGPEPRIEGEAWIVRDQLQAKWRFKLFLPHPVMSCDDVDWVSLLPPRAVTRWIALDQSGKYLEIDPAAAIPDPA